MKTITGKINLLMLKGAVKKMKGSTGEMDCLVIPILKNNLFRGEKGIYLDIIAFELQNKREGFNDTHLVKQSFSKEIRESFTDEQLKKLPIIGNLSVWGDEFNNQEPITDIDPLGEEDDLPF